MDKTALLNLVKSLELDAKAKNFLVNHIESSEMSPALANRVADVIDMLAQRSDLIGDLYAGVIDKVEELKKTGEKSQAEYQTAVDEAFERFLSTSEKALQGDGDQVKLDQVRQEMTGMTSN